MLRTAIFIQLILSINFFAQNNNFEQTLFELKFNNFSVKNGTTVNAKSNSFSRNDYALDNTGNIFFYNHSSFSIDKYNYQGKQMSNISLRRFIPDEQKVYAELDLIGVNFEIDGKDNLFCLLKYNELKTDLLKFDSSGNFIKKFDFGQGPNPKGFNTFYVSPTGNIFIYTFDVTQLVNTGDDKGRVLVYDNAGKYLGRSHFFIQDKDFNFYSHKYSNNSLKITKHFVGGKKMDLDNPNFVNEKTIEIKYLHDYSKHFNKYAEDRWFFSGIDQDNNLYYSSNKKIAKINFDNNTLEYIPFQSTNNIHPQKAIKNNIKGDIVLLRFVSGPVDTKTLDKKNMFINFVKINHQK